MTDHFERGQASDDGPEYVEEHVAVARMEDGAGKEDDAVTEQGVPL